MSDALWYHQTATLLAQGRGYVNPYTGHSSAAWPPGFPIALAALHVMLGPSLHVALLLNAAAGALTCVICWRLAGGGRTGFYAALLVAFFPSQIFFAPLYLSEPLFTAFACLLILAAGTLLERDAGRHDPLRWLLWGAGVGVAALVRAEATLFLGVASIAAARARSWRSALRVLSVTSLGALIVLGPWTYRNALVFGAFVPISTSFGRTLWIGHNEAATGAMSLELQETMIRTVEQEDSDLSGADAELARSRRYRELAMDYARSHPREELSLFFRRIYHLFRGDHVWSSWYPPAPSPVLSDWTRRWLGRLSDAYYLVVLLLAGVGWWRSLGARRPILQVAQVFVVIWVGFFALIYGDPRFHFPLLPIFCVMAAEAIPPIRSMIPRDR